MMCVNITVIMFIHSFIHVTTFFFLEFLYVVVSRGYSGEQNKVLIFMELVL